MPAAPVWGGVVAANRSPVWAVTDTPLARFGLPVRVSVMMACPALSGTT